MTASRSLYDCLARTINQEISRGEWSQGQKMAMAVLVRGIAKDLWNDNPNFKLQKFYLACGLDALGFVPRKP